jgi:hypothetical protein
MAMVISPAKTISLTKCRPNTTRKEPTAVPKMTALPSAKGRSCGGASVAGATVQKASLASPDTKEQFRWQAALGRHPRLEIRRPGKLLNAIRPRPAPMLLQHEI